MRDARQPLDPRRPGVERVYLDHNATTPLDPRALAAMLPYLGERFGNASSIHAFGREARVAVEEARQTIASLLGARHKDEIVFTGGGSEADNAALKGVCAARRERGRHLLTTAVEHPAVLEAAAALEAQGFEVTRLPVGPDGSLDLERLAGAFRPDTILLTLMLANNETGALFPVAEAARLARARGVVVHTDAVQAFGRIPVDVEALGVDLLSVSAHKVYGPKGVGALYVRPGTPMLPLHHGGLQERGRRAGTEHVAGIVGMAEAARHAVAELEAEAKRLADLRDRLAWGIRERVDGVRVNGHPAERLPNTLNVAFEGLDGEALLAGLDLAGIAVSNGSACSAGAVEPSHVLAAMGLPEPLILASVRFSLGRGTTAAAIDRVLEVLPPLVARLRRFGPRGGAGAPPGAGRADATRGR
jgi:cysteine desulfurase